MILFIDNDPKVIAWTQQLANDGHLCTPTTSPQTLPPLTPPCSPSTGVCICSAASAAGSLPANSQDGPTTGLFGQPHAPASHSAKRGSGRATQTLDTSGLPRWSLLTKDAPQSSWESRLQAAMGFSGSMEYLLTWKARVTPAGRRIYALRASTPRTSGNGSSGVHGYPTVRTSDGNGAGLHGEGGMDLRTVAQLVGYPTPSAQNMNDGQSPESNQARRDRLRAKHCNGNGAGITLSAVAQLVGYNTPRATDGTHGGPNQGGGSLPADAARLVGYPTASATDWKGSSKRGQRRGQLSETALMLAGYPTACARDWRQSARSKQGLAPLAPMLGQTSSSSPAATGKRGVLNPALARWLMAYPPEWCASAVTAMQSSPNSRRSSSTASSKKSKVPHD